MKIAVIDDWQNNARSFADWSRVEASHQLDFYADHLTGAALIEFRRRSRLDVLG